MIGPAVLHPNVNPDVREAAFACTLIVINDIAPTPAHEASVPEGAIYRGYFSMRNLLIGAAAFLAVAASSVATAQTGYVGGVYGNIDVNSLGSTDVYGGEGAVAFAGSDTIVFELDASVLDGDESDTSAGLTGHIYGRDETYLFGAFAGIVDSAESTTWSAGLEASTYYDDWTLAGALFYANNDDANADGYGVNVEARLFAADNFRLQGNVGWAHANFDSDEDSALTYGAGGEYQFDAAPVSIALGYNHTELSDSDADVDAAVISLRYNWGGSLRERDREGASQAGIIGFGSSFLAL